MATAGSGVGGVEVVLLGAGEVVDEDAVQEFEGGPLFGCLVPALAHDFIEGLRATQSPLGPLHPVASFHFQQHL